MASRLDLEARLRALRAPTATVTANAAQSALPTLTPESLPVAPVADVVAWPEPPMAWPEPPTAKPRRASSSRVPEIIGEMMVAPRRSSMSNQSSNNNNKLVSATARPIQTAKPVPGQSMPQTAPAAGVSVASLLGPAYTEAIQIGQFAIESERSRNVHTAIDAYIRAGQLLISIGRQQHTEHLQTIVKKKALALLERAEGLSDWVTSIMARTTDRSAAAVDAAFAESQRVHEQALDAKEALVAQMKAENSAMTQKLNQLAVLAKVRVRFRRMLSERRARKAEEALRRASLHDEDDSENNARSANCNDVEGDDGEGDNAGDDNISGEQQSNEQDADERQSSLSSSSSSSGSTSLSMKPATPAQREVQKRDLINELHARIGLPEISSLRKFAPLSADATKDLRHVELEDELEAARLEAERLRAAVQEMEECFQATLEQTRQQSLKLSKEKEHDLAQMEDELQRVRSELERERRLTASSFGSSRSNRSAVSDGDDPEDPDAFEDVAMIRSLRSSLHAMENPAVATLVRDDINGGGNTNNNAASGAASSEQSLCRGWSQSESDDSSDVDDDGGVWL